MSGLSGFRCEVTDQPVPFHECLACSRSHPADCPMIPAVIHASIQSLRPSDYAQSIAVQHGAQVGFSVTELLSCPRQTRLKSMHPYYEKPSALYRMNRGSAYHAMLSAAEHALPALVEHTLKWKFTFRGQSILLIGTPDLVEWRADGFFITDYKVTGKPPFARRTLLCPHCGASPRKLSERKYHCDNCQVELKSAQLERVLLPPQPRSSHVLQVNLYALLVEKNLDTIQTRIPEASAKFAGAQIVYLPDDKPARCDVELDRDRALDFLKARLSALLDPDLPPILDDPEEVWKCNFCPLRMQCEQVHGAPVGKDALEVE